MKMRDLAIKMIEKIEIEAAKGDEYAVCQVEEWHRQGLREKAAPLETLGDSDAAASANFDLLSSAQGNAGKIMKEFEKRAPQRDKTASDCLGERR